MNWYRVYHGMTSDAKLTLISKEAKATPAEVGWLWVALLERASENLDERGNVGSINAAVLSIQTGIQEDLVRQITGAFMRHGMLEASGHIQAWEKRQPRDETAAARQKSYRDRQRYASSSRHALRDVALRDVTQIEEIDRKIDTSSIPHSGEYPKTETAVISRYQTASPAIVRSIIDAAIQEHCGVSSPKIPVPDDATIAEAVEIAAKESGSRQNSPMLFRKTVPAVIRNWSLHGRHPPGLGNRKLNLYVPPVPVEKGYLG